MKKWKPKKSRWAVVESTIDENLGLVARFDGGCNPNPGGKASCACIIYLNGKEIHRETLYMGEGPQNTNNVAEFAGAILILHWALDTGNVLPLHIVGDSQIVIKRMRSNTLPSGTCRDMAQTALSRLGECCCDISWHWQPRAKNEVCDTLADEAIPDRAPWAGVV